jgi:hypothetical protein
MTLAELMALVQGMNESDQLDFIVNAQQQSDQSDVPKRQKNVLSNK